MGRAGRYTLAVMAWVAAFAGWSGLVGLVVAAVTGDEAREVSIGASALMTVIIPAVPTLVALWFNDWARDGFPTREQKRQRAEAAALAGPAAPAAPALPRAEARREVAMVTQPVHVTQVPAPPPVVSTGDLPVVPAHPLGVPTAETPPATDERFPVAPLLRDRD